MELIIIFGPVAVGKMTVGQAVARKTGFRLFHNHLTIDTLLPVFDWGSPSLGRLIPEFRFRVMEEAARSGVSLIHTVVWAFELASDYEFMHRVKTMVESHGGRISFVELQAPLAVRLERSGTENRAKHKPGNVERGKVPGHIEDFERNHKLASDGSFPFPERYLLLENSALEAEEAADRIIEHFGFKKV